MGDPTMLRKTAEGNDCGLITAALLRELRLSNASPLGDYVQSPFFLSPSSKTRDMQMTMRVSEGARRGRHEKRETTGQAERMVFHGLVIF